MARTKTNVTSLRSNRTLLALALLFAVVAAVLVFVAVNQGDGEGQNEGKAAAASAATSKTVVVANKDLPARTELTSDMLELTELPTEQALRDTFSSEERVVGQTTRCPLAEGEQVTLTKIGPQTETEREEGLSFIVPTGKRAFSIQISEGSSVGGLVLPGDLVDIIAILDEDDVGFDKAVTLLQNIEVLAVAQAAQESIPPPATDESEEEETAAEADGTEEVAATSTQGIRPEDVEANPQASTVTLAVRPEQSQLLALTQARGRLALSLRGYGDQEEVELDESTLAPWGGQPNP